MMKANEEMRHRRLSNDWEWRRREGQRDSMIQESRGNELKRVKEETNNYVPHVQDSSMETRGTTDRGTGSFETNLCCVSTEENLREYTTASNSAKSKPFTTHTVREISLKYV
jgi:hypothetical protein